MTAKAIQNKPTKPQNSLDLLEDVKNQIIILEIGKLKIKHLAYLSWETIFVFKRLMKKSFLWN